MKGVEKSSKGSGYQNSVLLEDLRTNLFNRFQQDFHTIHLNRIYCEWLFVKWNVGNMGLPAGEGGGSEKCC